MGEGAQCVNLLFGRGLLEIPGDEKGLRTTPDQRRKTVIGQQPGGSDPSEATRGAFHKDDKSVALQNEVGANFRCRKNIDASRDEALELLLDHIL